MKTLRLLCVLAAFQATLGRAQDSRLTIAVFNFDLPGKTAEASLEVSDGTDTIRATAKEIVRTNLLTDKLVTAIVKSNRLKVVERSRLDELLKESDLGSTDVADPAKCVEAGKLLGAQLLLFGTLDNIEAIVQEKPVAYTSRVKRTGVISLNASIRIVDAATGQIRAAQSTALEHAVVLDGVAHLQNKHFQAAQEALVMKLTYLVLDEVYPVKIVLAKGEEVYIGQGANNGVQKGKRFAVFRKGETITDPDTGVVLGAEQTEVGVVEVVRVEPKMSVARVVSLLDAQESVKSGDLCRAVEASARPVVESVQPPPPAVDNVFQ